ncbi:MAG: ATP-binding protein [Spirochaetales bacterium]|nr:ATP-binding protein [Spirochaetales bacterium]
MGRRVEAGTWRSRENGGEGGREALHRLRNAIGRVQSPWRPASAEESFEIVRRRLFQPVTGKEAHAGLDALARSFSQMYGGQPQEFPAECREGEYERRLKRAYPIHPELFDRLYNTWSTLDRFQRTRGVLRLMAKVIYSLWSRDDRSVLIIPASVPIDDLEVSGEHPRVPGGALGPHHRAGRGRGEVPAAAAGAGPPPRVSRRAGGPPRPSGASNLVCWLEPLTSGASRGPRRRSGTKTILPRTRTRPAWLFPGSSTRPRSWSCTACRRDAGQAATVVVHQVPALLSLQRWPLVVPGEAQLVQSLKGAVYCAAAPGQPLLDVGYPRPSTLAA